MKSKVTKSTQGKLKQQLLITYLSPVCLKVLEEFHFERKLDHRKLEMRGPYLGFNDILISGDM